MKGNKIGVVTALCIGAAVTLSGCSFSGTVEKLVGTVTETSVETVATQSHEGEIVQAYEIDESLDKPEFTDESDALISVLLNGKAQLQANASVKDGGTVQYQWNSNNVNSNGGGTKINGATGSTYTPDTSKAGTVFYYAVALNVDGNKANMTTGSVHQVTVWDDMYWQQNAELGGYQYISRADGSFPVNTSIEIDGTTFIFNDQGYAIDEAGNYVDVTVSGQQVGQAEIAPEAVEQTAEEQPAEAAPAEEQPAEAAPEEQPAG